MCFELWTSQYGWTALIAAADNGHHDVVGLLLDRGADMEAKDNVSRPLPSSPACQGQSLASDGLNATRPVHIHGVAQWRLGGGHQSGAGRIGMERELWSMCGRGLGEHVLQAGRAGRAGARSQFAGPCDVIESFFVCCGYRRLATRR